MRLSLYVYIYIYIYIYPIAFGRPATMPGAAGWKKWRHILFVGEDHRHHQSFMLQDGYAKERWWQRAMMATGLLHEMSEMLMAAHLSESKIDWQLIQLSYDEND